MRRARDFEEGGLEGVDVGGDDEVGSGESPAGVDGRQVERVEPSAPFGQGQAEQRLDRLVPTCPDRQRIECHEDDRDIGLDRLRRRLASEPALERDEREDRPITPAEDLAIEDAVPGERPGRLDDLREPGADVVQVARVEPHIRAALVELGADAVVLVLDPDLRPEPADDLGGVLGG